MARHEGSSFRRAGECSVVVRGERCEVVVRERGRGGGGGGGT